MQVQSREQIGAVTRDVNARGARVRFIEAGKGPTLLLIHGYLASHVTWEDALGALSLRFRVIAPDLPGFGESEKPSASRYPYTCDAFAESLVDLVAALGLTRVSVCGHALGGAVALVMAADHPDVVDRLVLVSPTVYPVNIDPIVRLAMQPLVGPIFFKQLYGARLFRTHFQKYVYGPLAGVSLERVDYLYEVFNAPAAREAAYATMSAMHDTRSLVARLPRVTAPTMVAWGRHDAANPITHGRRLAREIRGARFEVFECGHSPVEQCPVPFVESVSAFLEEAPSRPRERGPEAPPRERGRNGKVA
jgi:pimeloyl-ACP methyl ester carboxylesterase